MKVWKLSCIQCLSVASFYVKLPLFSLRNNHLFITSTAPLHNVIKKNPKKGVTTILTQGVIEAMNAGELENRLFVVRFGFQSEHISVGDTSTIFSKLTNPSDTWK